MCRSNLGIIIAERTEEDNVQAIRGHVRLPDRVGVDSLLKANLPNSGEKKKTDRRSVFMQ